MIANRKMGIAGIPGTFPTGQMVRVLSEWAESGNWDRDKVNTMYFAYKEGVLTKNYPIYAEGQAEVKEYIMEVTQYPANDVSAFLYHLYDQAQKNKIDQEFWNVELQRGKVFADPNIGPGNWSLNISKQIKWIGVLALIGVGLYFTWPLLRQARKRLSK